MGVFGKGILSVGEMEWEINTPSHYRLSWVVRGIGVAAPVGAGVTCSGLLGKWWDCLAMEIVCSFSDMVGWRVVFGEIICKITFAWSPMDSELSLFLAISKPIKAHVHGFRSLLFDCVIHNAFGTGIVDNDGCCALGVAEEVECDA